MPYCAVSLTPANCHSTGENEEAVKDVGREMESNLCLKRCSGVLDPSSHNLTVLDSSPIVRNSLERSPSFEGVYAVLRIICVFL